MVLQGKPLNDKTKHPMFQPFRAIFGFESRKNGKVIRKEGNTNDN